MSLLLSAKFPPAVSYMVTAHQLSHSRAASHGSVSLLATIHGEINRSQLYSIGNMLVIVLTFVLYQAIIFSLFYSLSTCIPIKLKNQWKCFFPRTLHLEEESIEVNTS